MSVSTTKHHALEKPLPSPLACLWLDDEDDEDDDEERDILTNGPRHRRQLTFDENASWDTG